HPVAVSCLADIDHHNVLPPITAYYVMRVGTLPLIPYFKPGDLKLADAVRALAGKHHAVLLANHGPVVAGTSIEAAVAAVEELEETAKLFLLLRGQSVRYLSDEQLEELGIRKLRCRAASLCSKSGQRTAKWRRLVPSPSLGRPSSYSPSVWQAQGAA